MYRMDGRVAFSDINERGYLSIVGILDYLQDCCTFHSEDVGYSVERLKEEHRGWFVTSWQIKVHDLPKHGERIVVKTMPTQVRGMIGERYFLIQDGAESHTYIEVKSLWVFMDTAEYKPARCPDGMAEAFCLDRAPEGTWGPRKIVLGENAEEVYTFTVANWQLDTNHHMNNKRYVEQAVTLLPADFRIGGMRIEYKKQATLGDVIHVKQVALKNGIQVWLSDEEDDLYFIMDFYRSDEE